MKKFIIITILLICTLSASGEELLTLTYASARRILNSNIEIKLNKNGFLECQTESRGKHKEVKKTKVSKEDMINVRKQLSNLNWEKVLADKMKGLDGNIVTVSVGDKKATVWAPNYDAEKRGLSTFCILIKTVFSMAGLKEDGLPKRK